MINSVYNFNIKLFKKYNFFNFNFFNFIILTPKKLNPFFNFNFFTYELYKCKIQQYRTEYNKTKIKKNKKD